MVNINSEVNLDIPSVQPLFFCIDISESAYLPSQYTQDEQKHLGPNAIENLLINSRNFQAARLIQGTSGASSFEIRFLKPNFDWGGLSLYDLGFQADDNTLIDKLISFEGRDAEGAYIRSDVGFDGTQASVGVLNWQPESVVTQNAGHYQSAHFLIETPDRGKVIQTLDFDLNIIANDVVVPEKYNFYVSELNRILLNFNGFMQSGMKQQDYYNALYVGILQNNIATMNDSMDKAIQNVESKGNAAIKSNQDKLDENIVENNKKIDGMVNDANDKKSEVDKALSSLETRQNNNDSDIEANKKAIADNATAAASNKVVTKDNVKSVIQDVIDNGDLMIGDSDAETDSKLDQMDKMLKGEM